MKRFFLSIFLILSAAPFFALGLQHDLIVGEANALDTALVFGDGKFKNAIGIYYESHETSQPEYENHSSDRSSSYGYIPTSSNRNTEHSNGAGLYYQFSWTPNFTNIGNIGIGMDLPLQLGIGADSVYGMNLIVGLTPAFKVEFNKFDLLIGYKSTILLAEASSGVPCLKSSATIGIRYSLKKGSSGAKATKSSTRSSQTSTDSPDNSSQQKVNIIPGTDIKTIYN